MQLFLIIWVAILGALVVVMAMPLPKERSWWRSAIGFVLALAWILLPLLAFEPGLLCCIAIPAALALPPAMKEKSWRSFFRAFILVLVVTVLPLFFFIFSFYIAPQSKSECTRGWLECFIAGKLALTPLVLFSTAAFYALEILRVKNRTAGWIVIGVFIGATIAMTCFFFGLVFYASDSRFLLLSVPLYVAVWYSWRAVQLIKAAPFGISTYVYSLVGSLPFWLASWWWSWSTYKSLPVDPSGCFVVTAASRGHEEFVGPFTKITRHGRERRVNQQLMTFWQLEELWRRRSPLSHCCFRRVYNRIGPVIARRLTSRWHADAACAALKPLEWTARFILKSQSFNTKRTP